MKRAIYAGSFDPPTNGHLWMIEEGLKLFDSLIVVIAHNSNKKSMVETNDREDMLTEMSKHLPLGQLLFIRSIGYEFLANYAELTHADFILRGVRSAQDFEYEQTMRHINSDINPKLTTVFLTPPRQLAEISSSAVKSMVGLDGWEDVVPKYVPDCIFQRLKGQV